MTNNKLVVFIADIFKFENNTILPQYVSGEIFNSNEHKIKQKRATYGLLKYAVKQVFDLDEDFSTLRKNENGKPVSDNYHLSISHKENLIAIAISNSNVGVDIEYVNEKINVNNIKKTILNSEESHLSLNTAYDIFNMWVKKESKFKFEGGEKLEPKNIKTTSSNFNISEIEYQNKSYLLGVCADDLNNLKIVDLT